MNESKDIITKQLKDTQEFCSIVQQHLADNFLVENQTMKYWKTYFKIEIPDEMNFSIMIKLAQEIWMKYQRAAYFRDSQQVQLAIMEHAKSDKYNTTYNNVRQDTQTKTGKPLAADSCKVAATLAVKDLDSAIGNQKVIHNFWVKTCDTLTELRKLTELICRALSGDAYLQKDLVIKQARE